MGRGDTGSIEACKVTNPLHLGRTQMKTIQLLVVFTFCVISALVNQSIGQVSEFDLANGVHVIVNSVDQATDVGVETFYEVGFVDEPEAMVQSSHLLEHLVCYSPGAGFEAKEAMTWLNRAGFANAETMPDFTHYDYASTADNLEKILEIEAARLKQTSFDPEMISFEAKRVYQETDFVENNPKAGMLKHAFMALAHAWRFQSKSALVRGGLEDMDAAKLFDFYKAFYQPQHLTIAITGKTTEEQVKPLVEKHFGKISQRNPDEQPIDWASVPARQSVAWDSKHQAVCIAWNPPTNKKDQVLISLLGATVVQKFMTDKSLLEKTEMVMCSNNMWMVGDLPLFVYAMAKPDQDLNEVEKQIKSTFAAEMKAAASEKAQMINSFAVQFDFQRKPTAWARMQQSSKMLQNMGHDENRSLQMVLAQDALQRCNLHRLLGPEPEKMIAAIKRVNSDKLVRIVNNTVTDENCHVVHIVPASD